MNIDVNILVMSFSTMFCFEFLAAIMAPFARTRIFLLKNIGGA